MLAADKRAIRRSAREGTRKKLCHNCDAKPVLAGKTDFIDDALLLILWNLLKTQEGPKIPAYMVRPPFSTAYKRQAFAMDPGIARQHAYKITSST